MDSALSIKNASGKTFSLLNETSKSTTEMAWPADKRKYHCIEAGCNKSFTTSGHLARHNRIHTGEKNFLCLHPGCPSRFSRQDNMMQHYRTHLSQKLRRQHVGQQQKETKKEAPQLYRHSFHGREDHMSFQPLMTRTRRAVTMPSLLYPPVVVNRPRRALSTSSSASCYSPPPSGHYIDLSHTLPPPTHYHQQHEHQHQHHQHSHYHHSYHQHQHLYQHQHLQHHQHSSEKQQQHHEWAHNSQKSSLLHLANIVSTFG